MKRTEPPSVIRRKVSTHPPLSSEEISLSTLKRFSEGWILDCEIRQHSKRTIQSRKEFLVKFFWFCAQFEIDTVDTFCIRKFLQYSASIPPGGRWGNPAANRAVSSGTIATWHRILKALFNWVVIERESPLDIMAKIAAPIDRPDAIVPFTRDEMKALIAAAKTTPYPVRDILIVSILFDTGIRASELCSIKRADVDIMGKSLSVVGKGNKRRTLYYASSVGRAMFNYMKDEKNSSDIYLFRSERGSAIGQQMTRNGVLKLIVRLGLATGIKDCHTHRLRHTAAVQYLINGGNQFSLMQMLGHTDPTITSRYVNIAKADQAEMQRNASPMDNLK